MNTEATNHKKCFVDHKPLFEQFTRKSTRKYTEAKNFRVNNFPGPPAKYMHEGIDLDDMRFY